MNPTPIFAPIVQLLLDLQNRGLTHLDAQQLLLHSLAKPVSERAWLFAHSAEALPARALIALEANVERYQRGEPLAYIIGQQPFYGVDLIVDQRVLVPRPDTETLVDWALELLPGPTGWGEGIVDLGTGSGAIALALKAMRPELQVSAIDASEDALAVARTNAERLQLEVHFSHASWLEGSTARFGLIVANPPYIAADDPHLDALRFEPTQALVSGADGLAAIRQIISQANTHLIESGWLLLEHGYDQASAVRDLLHQAGFVQVRSRCDLAGIERCSGGQLPALHAAGLPATPNAKK